MNMRSGLVAGVLSALLAGCAVYEPKDPEPDPGKDMIPICHNGVQTIRLREDNAVRAHLNHGDTLGECP